MSSIENHLKIDRYCAYCLKFLPAGTAKQCGKCRRRVYCSRECQAGDWKQEEGSQGHKNWCQLECGEEGIDWEIKEVPEKGLGVVAKRLIPAKYRIMVEAIRKHDHPGIQDLVPVGGTFKQKFDLNSLGCAGRDDSVLCLRLSRANHDCTPTSGHYYDETFNVKIMYSEREIQPGEEITISYYSCRRNDPDMARRLIQITWGIVCKEDCSCRNIVYKMAYKVMSQYKSEMDMCMARDDAAGAWSNAKLRSALLESIGASWNDRMVVLYEQFEVGLGRQSTLNEAIEYGKKALEIRSAILHPNSEELLEMKKYVEDPSKHQNYLYFEKEMRLMERLKSLKLR